MIIELHEKQDLEELLKRSHHEPVLLFKHSTQCSRSAGVIEDFEAFEQGNPAIPCGLILVIEDRDISDEVEERFGIRHESPQAILIVNEKPRGMRPTGKSPKMRSKRRSRRRAQKSQCRRE